MIYTFGENDVNIDNKEKKLSVSYDEEGRAVYFLESTIGEDNVLIWELRDERIYFRYSPGWILKKCRKSNRG